MTALRYKDKIEMCVETLGMRLICYMEVGKMRPGVVDINSSGGRKCAFCKHWYDPANSVISPLNSVGNMWNYKRGVKKDCFLRKMKTISESSCFKFESKM